MHICIWNFYRIELDSYINIIQLVSAFFKTVVIQINRNTTHHLLLTKMALAFY